MATDLAGIAQLTLALKELARDRETVDEPIPQPLLDLLLGAATAVHLQMVTVRTMMQYQRRADRFEV